ncbi:fungal-specific transcription factor domain-containing protein [Aspergillus insuetus]
MARLADTEAQIAHITSVTNIPNLQSSHGHQMNQQSQVKPRADGGFSESPFVPTKARPPGSDQTPSCVLRPSSATEGTNGGTQIHFSDGTSCNRQYFGATSAVVFASAVKEYIQRLGYEIPRASPTWQASLSSSETSSLSRSRSAIINEVVALLPQQTVATQLLSVYKNHVQEFAPMLFWPSILIKARRLYTSLMIVNDPVSFVKDFCVLNAIWSIGAQLSTPSEFSNNNRKETENGLRFFNLARKYHDLMVPKYDIDDATIALLMTVYLHGMALPGPCWTMAGVTSRIIQDIGLHKRAPVHLFTPTECEARNRIFWGAYTVDRTIALMLGRPIALDDSECSVDLPGEAVREDEMLPSTRIFRINIAVISRLHQIISYDATPGRETKDKTVLEAIDDDLSKCWLSYPKQFTDASLPGACEPSCLKSLFILQQARLTLMRHFTDIRLTSDFRRWCFTKSLMVSKTTARILDNFSNYPKLDASIAYRCNDLVCAHTFRALVVLLLGYGPCAHLSDITVEKLDLLPLWRLLHASSGRRTSAQKYLQLLHIISGALGFEFDDDFQIFQARHTQTDRSYPVRSGTIPNDYICDDSSSWNPRDKPWPLSITDPERTQDSSHGIDPEVNMDGQSHLSPDWSKHVAALFPASTPSAGLCVSDGAETQSVNQLFGHSTQTYDSNLNWDLFAKVMNFDSSAIAFDADSSSI